MKRYKVDDIAAQINNPILRSDFMNGKVECVNPGAATLLFRTVHRKRDDHPDRARVRYLRPIPPKNRV